MDFSSIGSGAGKRVCCSCLLGECGKACSESYSLNVYRKIREGATDIPDFFETLKDSIPEIGIGEIERGRSMRSVAESAYAICT